MPDVHSTVAARVGRSVPRLGQAIEAFQHDPPGIDPYLLRLCSQQIGQIASGRELTPKSGDPTEQACLQFAQSFCYSPQSVTDAHVADLLAHLSAQEVLALTVGLWVSDASERLANFFETLDLAESTQ
jgi:alkylhydroperoxidase family enzyme